MTFIFLLLFIAQTQSATELTLDQAVDLALGKNPLMRVAGSGIDVATAALKEAQAGRLPSVEVSEGFTNSNNPVFVFGSLLEQGRFGPQNFSISSLNSPSSLNNFRTSAAVNLPVLDQRRISTRIEQSRISQGQAVQQKMFVEQQIRFQTTKEFYGVLVARERARVSEEAVTLGESDVRRARDRFQTGLSVESDVLGAEVQLAEFQQQHVQALGELRSAQAAFRTMLGVSVDSAHEPMGNIKEAVFPQRSIEELLRIAIENRPDYRSAMASTGISGAQIREARGDYLPRLNVFASVGNSGRNPASGSADYTVGASVSFNLFDPKRSARQDEARAMNGQAAAILDQATAQLHLEVVRANEAYKSARDRIELAGRAVAQAAEALRIVQDRYEAGLTTITDVLRSETALVRARLNESEARYDQLVRYAALLLATGTLADVQPFM